MTKDTEDIVKVEILEDGTVSITTNAISGVNHVSADRLLKDVARLLGGQRQIRKRSRLGVHAHLHEHEVHHTH